MNVGYLGDFRLLESVQRRWTKQISGVANLDYRARFHELGLFSIWGRLLRADLIKCWRMFHSEQDVGFSSILVQASRVATRGHQFKLSLPVCMTELRRSFSVRSVKTLNSLSADVVESASLDAFKKELALALGKPLCLRACIV